MGSRILAAAVASALLVPAIASAADEPSAFSFSGFGTLGVVHTSTDKAEFASSSLQPKGASDGYDFGVDSVLGVQGDYKATDSLQFVGQLVSNRNAVNKFTPHVEWAFVRYAITGNLSVRGGIIAAPVFMNSESRLIGFSAPWVRQPTALYSQISFTNMRGVDASWRFNAGPAGVTLQPYYGAAPTEIPNSTDPNHSVTAHIKRMAGLNLTADMGAWTGRVGYMHSNFNYSSASIEQLLAGLRAVNALVPGAAQLASDLSPRDKTLTFTYAGVSYEGSKVFFQAEIGKRKTDLFLADTTAWYSSLGYRFGDVMPFATVSRVRIDSPTSSGLVPAVGPLASLAGGINTLLATQNYAQNTAAVGVRWQFAKNADVKVQWDRVKLPTGALGNFIHSQPGFAGSTVNVFSAAVDFVF
jgi:hypothetical protein